MLILRKSVKSLQVILNEFVLYKNLDYTVTASAFTQARQKLKHTAFIELNDDLIASYYKEEDYKTFHGYRLIGFDGSKLTLPKTPEINQAFGTIRICNHIKGLIGRYSRAIFGAGYDLLNNICIFSVLGRGDISEINVVDPLVSSLKQKDLSIFDRGYASYYIMSKLLFLSKQFIIRCPRKSFIEVQKMFKESPETSRIVKINVPYTHVKRVKQEGLPEEITIRLVSVMLPTGEIEVIATSLLDEFTPSDFKELYGLRWGVETFFGKLKGRLSLDNFTGKSVESIKQDLYSTILISNIETVITEDVETKINSNSPENSLNKKINKAVSFNAIKNMAFELFYTQGSKEELLDKLTLLFTQNTVVQRINRKVERTNTSDTQSLNFQKRKRKHVF